jgi:hypothetical protein
MKGKRRGGPQKPKPMDLPNPLKVDETEFTDIVRKMVNTPPETLEEVVVRRRKNPETDPPYLPVFDFTPATPEQITEVNRQRKIFAKRQYKKKQST